MLRNIDLLILFAAILFVTLTPSRLYAGNGCSRLQEAELQDQKAEPQGKAKTPVQDLLQEARVQEASWYLEDHGSVEQARKLTQTLEQTLHQENFEIQAISKSDKFGGKAEKYILTFSSGIKGIFKPDLRLGGLQNEVTSVYSSAQGIYEQALLNSSEFTYSAHEIAYYRLSRLLGITQVPLTLPFSVQDIPGSLQIWIPQAQPASADFFQSQDFAALIFLDYITSNADRSGNWFLIDMIGGEKKIVAIDHGAAFYPNFQKLIFSEERGVIYFSKNADPIYLNSLKRPIKTKCIQATDSEVLAQLQGFVRPEGAKEVLKRFHEVQAYLRRIPISSETSETTSSGSL